MMSFEYKEELLSQVSNAKSFDDVYPLMDELKNKEKGDLFELITFYLFKTIPELNHDLKNIWMYSDVPEEVLNKLGCPTRDKGIDIIIEKTNSKYYPVQCKFRQNYNEIITWDSLSTFFGSSFGMNNIVENGYFVSNTYYLCNPATNSDKLVFINGTFFDSKLPENFFKNIYLKFKDENYVIPYTLKEPFYYQKECLVKCIDALVFNEEERGNIVMACGSGKTITSYWIDKEMKNKLTVVLVPSLYLLSQFFTVWVNQSTSENVNIKYLLIGSDTDIIVKKEVNIKNNLLTTDPPKILDFILSNKQEKIVIISTYQSSDKLITAIDKQFHIDFCIFDEAHKTIGSNNDQLFSHQFSQMILDDNVKINKRLFMTATPKIYIGTDNNLVSMDNEDLYGEKLYSYNTSHAINDKLLSDYQVHSVIATNNEINQYIARNNLVRYKKNFENMESSYLSTIILLLKKINDGTSSHLVTYHNNVENAKWFRKYLVKLNEQIYGTDIYIASLSGQERMNIRKKKIDSFCKSKKAILCNVKILNEGVDIPCIDSICFVDNKSSTIDIVQSIGRSLRLHADKKIASIYVPTIIDTNDAENNKYGNLIKILKAMKTTDDDIVEYFMIRSNGKKNITRQICKYEYVSIINESKEIDLDEWIEHINSKLISFVCNWHHMFSSLEEYISVNSKLPTRRTNEKLAMWLHRQVNAHKHKIYGMKDPRKYTLFSNLILNNKQLFGSIDEKWENSYTRILEFIKNNKKLPSLSSKNKEEKSLRKWLSHQQQNCKHNEYSMADKEKRKKIKKLIRDNKELFETADEKWEKNFKELEKFVHKHQRLPSLNKNDEAESDLKGWYSGQVTKYKKYSKEKKATCEQYKRFNELINGSTTPIKPMKYFWDIEFKKLVDYVEKNKKLPSKKFGTEEEKRIIEWTYEQKRYYDNKYKKGKHSPEYEEQMKEFGMFLDAHPTLFKQNQWERMHDAVCKHIKENGKFPEERSIDKTIESMGRWIYDQNRCMKEERGQVYKKPAFRKKWNLFCVTYAHLF